LMGRPADRELARKVRKDVMLGNDHRSFLHRLQRSSLRDKKSIRLFVWTVCL
jgi:hypothetical protein